MKNIILILGIFTLIACSGDDGDATKPNNTNTSYTGCWKVYYTHTFRDPPYIREVRREPTTEEKPIGISYIKITESESYRIECD